MAVHRKFDALESLRPDVAIIPECANPETLSKMLGCPVPSMAWVGVNPTKGLGVFGFGDYTVGLDPSFDPRLQWIAPVNVTGPHPFFLLGAWCMDHLATADEPWLDWT